MAGDREKASGDPILEVLLDSWDRNNRILVNLLRLLPPGGMEARAMLGSPTVAETFGHLHYVRMVFLSEDAPEFGGTMAGKQEWAAERDPDRLAAMLDESARAVAAAVRSRVEQGRGMDLHYDHPVLFLQHMIWHEGYHHGQIKLALKAEGCPIGIAEAGPATWRVWTRKG